MGNLVLHGREVATYFDLVGYDENDMTGALGWALSRAQLCSPRRLASEPEMPRTGSFLGAALLHRQELRSRLVLTHHHPDHAVNVA